MTQTQRALQYFGKSLLWLRGAVPGAAVSARAVPNYVAHQSANQAGSVAFSARLSLFPLLLFLPATAA